MTILTRDEIAAALCLGALEPDARTLRQAGAVLSLLASKSETPETAKYPLKATKEMLDAAEISWNRSYEYEPYRFEKMLNAALAVVTIPLAESEQRGDRCAYVFTGREAYLVGYPDKLRYRSGHLCDEVRADHPLPGHAFMPAAEQCAYRYDPSMPSKGVCLWTRDEHPGRSEHAFVPPVSPKPPLGDAAGSEDADLKALIAEAREAHKRPCPHMATRCCTSCYGNRCEDLLARLIDALEARESPLPSPAEFLCVDHFKTCVESLAHPGWCEAHGAKPAGPALSVERAHPCPDCKHDTPHESENVYCEKCNCDRTAVEGFWVQPATVAPSPVDTMVSAADAFEKMRAARDAYAEETSAGRIGRAIVAFMDSVIAMFKVVK